MIERLLSLEHAPITKNVNYKQIPCTAFQINEEGTRQFNEIYRWVREQGFSLIKRTPSGGISIKGRNFRPMYDVRCTKAVTELTLITAEGCWRIQCRALELDRISDDNIEAVHKKKMYGKDAFKIFSDTCRKFGIKLTDYHIENGKEVKEEIEKPLIGLNRMTYKDTTFSNVHHLDFNSSYSAGLVNCHPEFKEAIEYMYEHRKDDDNKFKLVLNASIGYMQSLSWGAKLAQLSRDAINDNNRRILELAEKLQESDRVILAYNTDGIWYTGDIYHDANEGKGLGQWKNDHINCKFRAKSAGAYEFIENGQYKAVVRGLTKLDTVKARDQWQWGDIYNRNAGILKYKWSDEQGLIEE